MTIRMRNTLEDLTPREMDVLHLMAQGLGNRDIAERLEVNERTVKYHVSTILSKLDVTNRTEAVTLALRRGLITLQG